MPLVTINSPKTPITKGSNGIAAATVPNVCKMPGLPVPLPNIGQSGRCPEGYSKTVTIEGDPVAIRGASFGSVGDIASKATGGGIVSNNVEGPTKFIALGSLDVMIEGRNVQLLGDQMLNNCGPSGSPPNAATMQGVMQAAGTAANAEAEVACAIWCCDQKPYPLPDTRGGRKTCQRLANRKHSCVLHKLRQQDEDRLTQKDKFSNIKASPRHRVPGIARVLIPDAIANETVIDAKFPCNTSDVHGPGDTPPGTGPGFTSGAATRVYASTSATGADMITKKELREYAQIDGVHRVMAMTPYDANANRGDCTC